ncbi:MAG: hypothetical protein UHD64_08425, partial [Bacteroidales bacterium]|nr:hypothetical protein [Bacteroidales bacterium]
SEWLRSLMGNPSKCNVVAKEDLVGQISLQVTRWISSREKVVVMTLGAGDIERQVNEIKLNLNEYE